MGLAKRLTGLIDDLYLNDATRDELRRITAEVALLESGTAILNKRHEADALLIETLRAELDAMIETERDTKTIDLDLEPKP